MLQRTSDDSVAAAAATQIIGKLTVSNYHLQFGAVYGAMLRTLASEDKIVPRPRPAPVLLRPSMPDDLFDRDDEIGQATAAVKSGEAVELHAPDGSGKTALLAYLSHNIPLEDFPDGLVYQSVSGCSAGDVLQLLFDAFYVCDAPFKPTDEELRHALHNKRAVVLLDDLELEACELERMMNLLPRSVFIIAAQESRLQGEGRSIAVSGLPLGAAVTLFDEQIGDPGLAIEDVSVAQQLCKALDRQPLRIRQVAALVREDGLLLQDIVDQLSRRRGFDRLILDSLKNLSFSQRQVLGVLAALDGAAITAERLSSITKLPNARDVTEALRMRALVDAVGERYRLCPDLSDAVKEQVSPEWAINLILHFRDLAEKHRNAPDRLSLEIDAILQVLQWVVSAGLWADVLAIARPLEGALAVMGRWDAWGQVLDWAFSAARKLDDRREEAWVVHQQGIRALCLDNVHTAKKLLANALSMRKSQGDTAGAEATRRNLELVENLTVHVQDPFEANHRSRTPKIRKVAMGLALGLLIALASYAVLGRRGALATPVEAIPTRITSFSIPSSTLIGGNPTVAKIQLNRAVPASDATSGSVSQAVVELVADEPNLIRMPRTVTIPPQQSEVTVRIETVPVSTTRTVKLTAMHAGIGQEYTVVLRPELTIELAAAKAYGGRIIEGSVMSKAPAPAGGLRVPLRIGAADAVKGPSEVLIREGENWASFELETLPVSSTRNVEITAAYEALRPRAVLTVQAGVGFLLLPASVYGGDRTTATVMLGRAAPAGGSTFTLTSDNSDVVQVPNRITVPEGKMFAEFEIETTAVGNSLNTLISASRGAVAEHISLKVLPKIEFFIDVNHPAPNGDILSIVTLPAAAKSNGWIYVEHDDAYVAAPSRIEVVPGQSSVTFPIRCGPGAAKFEIAVRYEGVTRSATVTDSEVRGEVLQNDSRNAPLDLRIEPSETTGGKPVAAFIEFGTPVPEEGAVLNLRSNHPAVIVPAEYRIPKGEKSASFVVHAEPVGRRIEALISASYGGHTQQVPITVRPDFELFLTPDEVVGGYTTVGHVVLNGPVPSEGATFELVSSDASLAQVPKTVSIREDQLGAAFEVRSDTVPAQRRVAIIAKYDGVEKTVWLTSQMDFEIMLDNSPGKPMGTIQLSGPAPQGGAWVELKSNVARVAEVPASVTVPPGETSAMFPLTIAYAEQTQTVSIVASYAGIKRKAFLEVPTSGVASHAVENASVAGQDSADTSTRRSAMVDQIATTEGLQAMLLKPTRLEVVNMSLRDVIAYLKDVHRIDIELDSAELHRVGISSDMPITVDIIDVPLGAALQRMLSNAKLTYEIRDEVLLITTPEQAERHQRINFLLPAKAKG